MLENLLAAARAGARTELGVISLLVIAGATIAYFLVDPEGLKPRLKVLAGGLAGLALFIAASHAALPPPLPTVDAPVVLIDETADYRNGQPGGMFDASSTVHMIRYGRGVSMWTPAGQPNFGVGWVVYVVEPATYRMEVEYSADKSRPAEVRLDDVTLRRGLAGTTASRLEPRWFDEGTLEFRAGYNRLAFYNHDDGLPWINAVRLTRLEPPG